MKKLIIATALLAASSAVMAEGFYGGGSVGYTRSSYDCTGTTSCKLNDIGLKGFLGYQINDMFSAELSYFDLGKTKFTALGVDGSVRSTGLGVRGLFSFPFSKEVTGFVSLGLNRNKSDATVAGASQSKSSTKPSASFGVDYAINKTVAIRGELESTAFKDIVDQNYTVLNASVGVKFSF